jgi:ribonuclease inhibitor
VLIDGRRMRDRAGAHAYLAKKLSAPAWYGNNLDALMDVLSACAEPTRFAIRYAASIERNLGDYGKALLGVFRDAAAENERITLAFLPPEPCGN